MSLLSGLRRRKALCHCALQPRSLLALTRGKLSSLPFSWVLDSHTHPRAFVVRESQLKKAWSAWSWSSKIIRCQENLVEKRPKITTKNVIQVISVLPISSPSYSDRALNRQTTVFEFWVHWLSIKESFEYSFSSKFPLLAFLPREFIWRSLAPKRSEDEMHHLDHFTVFENRPKCLV